MNRLFLIALAFVITLGAALGSFLFVSLWPYFNIIGKVTAGVVITGMVCVAVMIVSFTFNRIGVWQAGRLNAQINARVIIAGEVVVYPMADGTFVHLSAVHESAKVVPRVTVKELPPPKAEDSTVLELYNSGVSLRNIAESTGLTYYQVQKITSGKS